MQASDLAPLLKLRGYNHPDNTPDEIPNEELEAKRRKIDIIGGAIGTAIGLGAGGWRSRILRKDGRWKKKLPYMLAVTTAGYGMGRAGAYAYGTMYHPREKEILEKEQDLQKSSANHVDINGLAIPERHKDLLAMSRAYVAKKHMGQTQELVQRKEIALAPKTPAKSTKTEKTAKLSVPLCMYNR